VDWVRPTGLDWAAVRGLATKLLVLAYRFGVRAAAGASHDRTPATFGFKVLHVKHG
jgi:hypothetical protein